KSTDGGASWSDGTFTGYNPPDAQDKEWAVVDWTNLPSRGNIYLTWADLDNYSSSNPMDSARIMFSKSTDGAATWSTPKRISKTAGNCGFNAIKGAVPAVGPNGEIYVAWCGNGVSFQKSTDGGNTWLPQDVTIDFQPSWYFTIPGMTWGNGFPSIACDISGGGSTGNIYVSWADTRNGANNSDVFLARSTDGGSTWNTVRINDDITTNHNFHPWVTVDQVTGYVYVVFYDRRNYTNDSGTDVYLAYSTDGGAFWANEKISTTSFLGSPWDYNNVVAHNKIIRPIWAQSSVVYTALINHDDLPVGYDEYALLQQVHLYPNYPNPFYDQTTIKFSVPENITVGLKLFNNLGEEVANIIDGRQYNKGWHEVPFYASHYNLKSGLYSLQLSANGQQHTIRVMVQR
ncbi:MAG: exo-alpha-sialidase, partial [Flavobacteriales bacterium]